MKSTIYSRSQQTVALIGFFILCFATSALGAMASINAKSFYSALVQPSWAPPGWLFGPVWTVLFALMALAAWLVWRSQPPSRAKSIALMVFVAQLVANALWSWLFFSWKLGGAAFADIIVLWALIALTIVLFWRFSKLAAAFLVPYLAWVSFAALLNWTLWRTNPAILG
jgi:translocator protein